LADWWLYQDVIIEEIWLFGNANAIVETQQMYMQIIYGEASHNLAVVIAMNVK
jgi:hypothetical protein